MVCGARRTGWSIELEQGADSAPAECGAVLLALPSHKIASLEIITTPALEVSSLAEVYYPPVASVVLGFRRADVAHPLDGFGMLIPEKEGFNILGALFSSSLFPNRAPEGEVTITCYIGGARAPLLPLNTAEALTELAVKDLGTILGVRGRPTFQHVAVYRQAIPQYNLGFGKFRALMSDMESKAPGLFVAGHARDGISVGDSIVSGHKAAGRIQAFLASDRRARRLREPPRFRMNKRAVLLVNLGSPDSASVEDVRAYLGEFLMDGRVLDVPYPAALVHRSSRPFCPSAPRNRPRPTRKSGRPKARPWWRPAKRCGRRCKSAPE